MVHQFTTQFYSFMAGHASAIYNFARTEPRVILSDPAKIQQKLGKSVEDYLSRFKMAKIRCHVSIPKREVVQIA